MGGEAIFGHLFVAYPVMSNDIGCFLVGAFTLRWAFLPVDLEIYSNRRDTRQRDMKLAMVSLSARRAPFF